MVNRSAWNNPCTRNAELEELYINSVCLSQKGVGKESQAISTKLFALYANAKKLKKPFFYKRRSTNYG